MLEPKNHNMQGGAKRMLGRIACGFQGREFRVNFMQRVVTREGPTHQPLAPGAPLRSYYRARYYDPNIGRFLAEDPIRFRAGTDFYSYARNRPAILRDPTGRIAWGGGIVGSLAGGVFWFGGGGEGAFYWVGDSQGNQGVLSCSGLGLGAVTGASAAVQGGSAVCPDCKSICDMEGTFGGIQAFGGVGATGAAGGGASVSNTGVTIFTSGGAGGGAGGVCGTARHIPELPRPRADSWLHQGVLPVAVVGTRDCLQAAAEIRPSASGYGGGGANDGAVRRGWSGVQH